MPESLGYQERSVANSAKIVAWVTLMAVLGAVVGSAALGGISYAIHGFEMTTAVGVTAFIAALVGASFMAHASFDKTCRYSTRWFSINYWPEPKNN